MDAHGSDEIRMFTGRVNQSFRDVNYSDDCYLMFGRETAGLPPELIEANKSRCVRIPMRDGLRSLNLANSVAIGVFEALRQTGDAGLI